MFQRGKKIVILESSAGKKTHPRTGDVGYLDNMYLFTNDKFILLDAFFFQYGANSKHNKDRVEKKRFIIDLGMKSKLGLNISNGVPLKFFVNKYHINLTSTGYATTILNDVETLIDYPLIHSNYGIWNSVRRSTKNNFANVHISKELYKIPYGHIALFSSRYSSKYKIEERGDNEFIAWIRSMVPIISSMLKIFCSYKEGIELMCGKSCLDGAIDDCFVKTYTESSLLRKYIKYLYANAYNNRLPIDTKYMTSGYHILESIKELNRSEKSTIIRNINFINSLNNIFMQRLDTYYINRFNQRAYEQIRNYIRNMWNADGALNNNVLFKEIMPTVDIIESILCRTIIMKCNTSEKINSIANYLPSSSSISLKNKIDNIDRTKLEAGNNSSALNRIYDIVR